MKRSLGLLIGGALAFWAVMAYPAYLVWGEPAVVFSAVAALLCLVPATLTLIWCHKAFQGGSPEQQLLAVMGGTAVRLVVVIAAGMALYFSVPYFHRGSFWLWVVVFYLVTLTVEIGLIVARQSAAERPQNH